MKKNLLIILLLCFNVIYLTAQTVPTPSFYTCDDFDSGPAPDLDVYISWGNWPGTCGTQIPFNMTFPYTPTNQQELVNNTIGAKWVPWLSNGAGLDYENTVINAQNGLSGGNVLSINKPDFPLVNGGVAAVPIAVARKKVSVVTTGTVTFSFDQQSIIQSPSEEQFFKVKIFDGLGNMVPVSWGGQAPSPMHCYGPGSSWLGIGWPVSFLLNYRYKDWYSSTYSFQATAGNTYYIEFAVGACDASTHKSIWYIDNLCIQRPEQDLKIESTYINDDDCDQTVIKGKIYYPNTENFTFDPSTMKLTVKQNNIAFGNGTMPIPSPGLTINYGNYINPLFSPGYVPYTIVIDNNIIPLPINGGYDIEVGCTISNAYGYTEDVVDDNIYNGPNNDGDLHCCTCGAFTDSYMTSISGNTPFGNGATLPVEVHVDEIVTFNFEYDCQDVLCDVDFADAEPVSTNGDGIFTTNVSGNILQVQYTGSINDVNNLISITVTPKCGPNDCTDSRTVYFNVGHCACATAPVIKAYHMGVGEPFSPSNLMSSFPDVLTGGWYKFTVSSPCDGCYDCANFEVFDHNLPNASFFYNPKTKEYEITTEIYPVDACNFQGDDYFIRFKSQCGQQDCSDHLLEFETIYSGWEHMTGCLKIVDLALVQSMPGSGIYDAFQFGVINNAPPLPGSPYAQAGGGIGPNIAVFDFPSGVLATNQPMNPPPPIGPNPALYPNNYVVDNNRLFVYMTNNPSTTVAQTGEVIAHFRIKVNPNSLNNGFFTYIRTFWTAVPLTHYDPITGPIINPVAYNNYPEEYNMTQYMTHLNNGMRSQLYCDSTIFCVSNGLPQNMILQNGPNEKINDLNHGITSAQNSSYKGLDEEEFVFSWSNEILTIEPINQNTSIDRLTILNYLGQRVYTNQLIGSSNYRLSINDLGLAKGAYVVVINDKQYKKIIVD